MRELFFSVIFLNIFLGVFGLVLIDLIAVLSWNCKFEIVFLIFEEFSND